MSKEIMVFDKPLIETQRFEVSIPNQKGRVTVIRKEVTRKKYHMGCIDDIPDGHTSHLVSYEVFREVDDKTRAMALKAVEREREKL